NSLVYTIDQERMPVLPTGEEEFETWLDGSAAEAFELAREYPPEEMWIVQEGLKKEDLSQCQCIVALLNSPLRLTIGPSASVGGRPRSTRRIGAEKRFGPRKVDVEVERFELNLGKDAIIKF